MATFTTITDGPNDLVEALPAEELIAGLIRENRAPLIAHSIAQLRDFRERGSSRTQNIIRIRSMSASKQSTEGSELTASQVDLDEESITPDTRYLYVPFTLQGAKDFAVSDLERETAQMGVRAILDQEEADGLAEFQNAIASVGSSVDTFDLTLWRTMVFTYASLDAASDPVFVGHEIHIRDLLSSIQASGGTIESTGRAADLFRGVRGLRGEFEGIPVFGTTNVVEAGSAKVGALVGMDVLQYGVWDDIQVLRQLAVENLAVKLVVWSRTGFALATNGEASTGEDSSIVKVLCKNT